MDVNYPTNTSLGQGQNKPAPAPEKVESVIKEGTAKISSKKKSLSHFIFEQDLADIKEGVVNDIIRPKAKELVYTIVNGIWNTFDSGIQMMIFGDVRRNPNGGARVGDRVSYNQFSKKPATPSMSSVYNYDDISYESRGVAEAVLESMQLHLTQYPWVTVAQMYEYANLSNPLGFTANNYGWSDLSTASVKRSFDGEFVIDLPKARAIPK